MQRWLFWAAAAGAVAQQRRWQSAPGPRRQVPRRGGASPDGRRRLGGRGALYLYEHIPKAGGVSYASDLVERFGLKSCFGRQVKKVYENVTWAMARRKCDFGNTEGGYAGALERYPWPPRVLLLLRDPAAHVVSQFSHCQMASDLKKWGHDTATLDDWLDAWRGVLDGATEDDRERALARARRICHFDPVNMATRKLCGAYDTKDRVARTENDTRCLGEALEAVRDAWHVSVLERYDRGLCALSLRLRGKVLKHCDCGNPTEAIGRKEDHGAHSSSNRPSAETRAKIAAITDADAVLWRAASARFEADARSLEAATCRRS